MSKLPRYSRWRPDFEAPGPHVYIEKKESISFEDPQFGDMPEDDEDDGYSRQKYYESDKILGKLYRAIDERKIFEEVQARSRRGGSQNNANLMDDVWSYVKQRCRNILWEHKIEWAQSIRDM